MSDEIYDYFAGNSSRKVEPLDESELFPEDLPENEPAESEPAVVSSEPTEHEPQGSGDSESLNPESEPETAKEDSEGAEIAAAEFEVDVS